MSATEFRRSERVLWRRAGADAVAALPEGDDVHVLTGGAGAVWWALEEPGTAKALVDDVAMLFGVASDTLAPEVGACLEELVSVGLVERS